MEQQVDNYQDEISIREIIEALLKGKILITVLTIIAIVMGCVAVFFIMPEIYESKTILMADPIEITASDLENVDGNADSVIEYLTKLPNMTMASYIQLLKSQTVLDNTIKTLNLTDSSGEPISVSALSDMISVSNTSSTNLIEITVSGQDPLRTTEIANTLSQCFIDYVTENTKRQSQIAADLIAEQLAIEEDNLKEKSQALAEYWAESDNIDLLKSEVDNLVAQISTYKTDLLDIETKIKSDRASLSAFSEAYPNMETINTDDIKINLDISSTNSTEDSSTNSMEDSSTNSMEDSSANNSDNSTSGALNSNTDTMDQIQISSSFDQFSEVLVKIEINKIQTRLVNNSNQQQAMTDKVAEMKNTLTEKQTQLTEEEYQYDAINRELELAKQTYDAYQQRHKEAVLAAAADMGATSIIVTSEAIVPDVPVSPNKISVLLIAVFLGFFLGCLIVLFRYYWINSKPTKRNPVQ